MGKHNQVIGGRYFDKKRTEVVRMMPTKDLDTPEVKMHNRDVANLIQRIAMLPDRECGSHKHEMMLRELDHLDIRGRKLKGLPLKTGPREND